jgi:hypothetical protein
MDTQSKLEIIGKKYRDNSLVVHGEQVNAIARNDYHKNDPYNENHIDAKSDPTNTDPNGKPLGKSMGSGHGHTLPNQKLSSDLIVPQINTLEGGGSYDILGRSEFQSGRNYLQNISLYNKNHQYNKQSVIIDDLIDGQYLVK